MNQNTMDRGVVASHTSTVEAGHGSAVSWGAIVAGAAAAGAFSLIMLVLGVGLGMSSVSPWAQDGVSAKTLGVGSIAFLTLTTLLASGLGGYLAGRLRSRWAGAHTDEVYFRDTAHGFLAWAVATLVTAAMLSSTIGAVIGAGAKAVGSTAGAAGSALMAAGGGAAAAAAKSGGSGAGGSADDSGPGMGYFVDSLFRRDATAAPATPGAAPMPAGAPDAGNTAATTREVATILAQSLRNGSISQDDVRYAGSIVAQRAGISQQDAEKRINDTYQKAQNAITDAQNKAKEAADKARKASSYASLWLFVTFLIGALAASFAATYGGRRRDL